jgi:hypothetical protein
VIETTVVAASVMTATAAKPNFLTVMGASPFRRKTRNVQRWLFNRDSPDDSQTGANICAFPAFLQDRREGRFTSPYDGPDPVDAVRVWLSKGKLGKSLPVQPRPVGKITRGADHGRFGG